MKWRLLELSIVLSFAPGCGLSGQRPSEHQQSSLLPQPTDLVELAAARGVKPITGSEQAVFLHSFSRQGVERATLVMIPGGVFETGPLSSEERSPCVSLFVGMPFNLGDGATLVVTVNGDESELIRLHVDPAHVRQHRRWIPLRIKLPPERPVSTLRFSVHAGPRGDGVGDWIGVASGPESECLLSERFGPLR